MNKTTSIVNAAGDYEETILRLAKHLGRGQNRRDVFNLIYGRGSRPRSRKQIADQLGRTGNTQVIQDSLDELAKHQLVVRLENNGHVKDGSRFVYTKAEFVRANRNKIVKYADNPAAARDVPTKRRPLTAVTLSLVKPAAKSKTANRPRKSVSSSSRRRSQLKIALLVTNPDRQASLQTGIEGRDIEAAIRSTGRGSEVDLKILLAPTLSTLLDMLNSFDPDVIHFSGHGGGQALVFDNERAGDDGGTVLDFDMVARVVGATSAKPKLLVLAACDTVHGANRLLDSVPVVVAMSDSIDDEAACEFSCQFYKSIGNGASIGNSLKQSKLVLESKGYADASLPTLLTRDGKGGDRVLMGPAK